MAIGPADRTAFFAEQARRRRHAAGWGLLCLGLSAGIGAVLSTVTGPLLLLLAAATLKLLAWAGLAPSLMRAALRGMDAWILRRVDALGRGLDVLAAADGPAAVLGAAGPLLEGSALVLPGALLAVLVWAGLARFHRRSALAAAVAATGARPARETEFEERQLGNILAELSLAAGLPVPRLLLVDVPQPNAAAFGPGYREAAVIATTGLLGTLNRRETAGVAAHLVASVGSGDLRLAAAVQAVLGTLGAMMLVFDLPFRRGAWAALRDLVLALAGRLPPEGAERLSAGLAAGFQPESMDAMTRVMRIGERAPPFGALLVMPLLPWFLLTLAQKLLVMLWMLFVFGWPLALLWRARRYLADAVAVQLLRDPEALAGGLRRIQAAGPPPGGALQELGYVHLPDGSLRGLRERASIILSLTPPLGHRLARLAALGAGPAPAVGLAAAVGQLRRLAGWRLALTLFLTALLIPLLAALTMLVGMLLLGASVFLLAGGLAVARLVVSL